MDLIKFRQINDFLKISLSNETFYVAALGRNDPVEKVLFFGASFNLDDPIDFKHIYSYGIYSAAKFKAKHFSTGLLPMWAYYGDNHAGVILVLRPKNLDDWVRVDYSNPSQVNLADMSKEERAKKVLSYKLAPWSHEDEYRLIFPPEKVNTEQPWSDWYDLKQVVFGYRCAVDKINEVLSWLSPQLKQNLRLDISDKKFLDIRKVREPFSVVSDLHPYRISLDTKLLEINGYIDTLNSNAFYELHELYLGQSLQNANGIASFLCKYLCAPIRKSASLLNDLRYRFRR